MVNEVLNSIYLGIVQGLTEFLPISSTAHMIFAEKFLQTKIFEDKIFETIIQMGSLLALFIVRFTLFKKMIFTFHNNKVTQKLISNLIIAFLPAGIIGAIFNNKIASINSTVVMAYSLIVGGILFIIIDLLNIKPQTYDLNKIGIKQALGIGTLQLLAFIPGVSRSGATIAGGILIKLNRNIAVEFSFLLGFVTILAASVFKIYKNYYLLNYDNIMSISIGFITAFIVSLLVINISIKVIVKYGLKPFGVYRIILGLFFLNIIR
ncbi:MAG: undecaprenyl-diphosphate phosphatase [Sphingobacteriia bacterium]|nr:undecaprenyl-diphosphate phosphatase [Sphingobacteriia bacterium]